MDCCRTSKRLGAHGREGRSRAAARRYFKASPWELEDAEEELVEIVENHAPKRFVIENGKLVGMEFEQPAWTIDADGKQTSEGARHRDPPLRRRDPRHRPGQRLPVDRARHRHRVRQVGHAGGRQDHLPVLAPRRLLRRRRGVGTARTSSGRWSTGTRRPSRIHNHCEKLPLTDRPEFGMNLVSAKMGMHAWAYSNDYNPSPRAEDEPRGARRSASRELRHRGGARLHRRADGARSGALPQLRHRDALHREPLHRVRRLRGRVPRELSHHRARRRRGGAAHAPDRRRR